MMAVRAMIRVYDEGKDEVRCLVAGKPDELWGFAKRNVGKMFLLVSCDTYNKYPGVQESHAEMEIVLRGEPGYVPLVEDGEQITKK